MYGTKTPFNHLRNVQMMRRRYKPKRRQADALAPATSNAAWNALNNYQVHMKKRLRARRKALYHKN